MAHFAKIGTDNLVEQVIVIDNGFEHRGQDYINNELGLEGEWIQTSYNHNFRSIYAGIGFTYDRVNDVFIGPQPAPSWTLDENFHWQPPVPHPEGTEYRWRWDEENQLWYDPFA